jgi:glutathione S-transferase
VIELYYLPGSAAFAVHAALEETGAEYRLIRVHRDGGTVEPPELLRLNPAGRVPTMTFDGMPMTESAACLMHVSDLYPEAGLAPAVGTEERAQWYRWLTFLTNTVQPAFMNFTAPRRAAPDEAAEAVKSKAVENLAGMRERIESHLGANGPYLLGEQFTSADLFLAMVTRWCRRLDPKWWDQPHLGEHWRTVRARPSMQRVYEQEELEE